MAGTEFPDGGLRLLGLIGDPVAQVVMKPPVTTFLQATRDRGDRTQMGEAVMLYQLDALVAFLLGT